MEFKLYQYVVILGLLCLSTMTFSADQVDAASASDHVQGKREEITFKPFNFPEKIEAAQLFTQFSQESTGPLAGADIIIANQNGLSILDKRGERISNLKGYYTTVDHRIFAQSVFLTSVSENLQQAIVTTLSLASGDWTSPLEIPKPQFKIEDACLYQNIAGNTFVFLVGEEGLGEQWLVADGEKLLQNALLVRSLSLPPESKYCQVDDRNNTLFVNEENVGLWAYRADDEAELQREPIAMVAPFGDIKKNVSGMAVLNEQLLVLDSDSQRLHRYMHSYQGDYIPLPFLDLAVLNSPENMSVRPGSNKDGLDVLVHDKDGLHIALFPADVSTAINTQNLAKPSVVWVKPLYQTDLMPSLGDAADDPAIWLNPVDSTRSLVLATDKQGGLAVYDLQGREQQYLGVGRLNNVDIRTGFSFKGGLIDLAVASNRDHNSLHLFSINRETGTVADLGEQSTDTNEIYGTCMFKDKQGRFYAIVNDKSGSFEQYELTAIGEQIKAKKVRQFSVASQPEGCVSNDQTEQLFVGEENVAVWSLNARADEPTNMAQVIKPDNVLQADIEGLAYYRSDKNEYLVISSQGNDSYVVVEAYPPYENRGVFKVVMNPALGLDGASETDGLDVTSADLSGNHTGPWQLGMLVVQDGRKRMPEGKQNYKYVPWLSIAEALGLE